MVHNALWLGAEQPAAAHSALAGDTSASNLAELHLLRVPWETLQVTGSLAMRTGDCGSIRTNFVS